MGWGASAWKEAGAIASGLGMQVYNNKQQVKQQGKLIEQQMQADKYMSKFNQGLAIDTWNRTNMEAQRKHMEAAGLNVGLMYGGVGGQGGTTSQPGKVSAASAQDQSQASGMGIQLGLQAAMQKAQIDNLNANTENTKVDTAKTAGVDTANITAETGKKTQETRNAEIQAELMELDKQIKEVELNVKGNTKQTIIDTLEAQKDKLQAEAKTAGVQTNVQKGTQAEQIEQARLANEATKSNIEQTKQNTTNLKQDEIQKTFDNELRKNGIQPNDNIAARIAGRVIQNSGASLKKIQSKMGAIIQWIKGENGAQTSERFSEIWNE